MGIVGTAALALAPMVAPALASKVPALQPVAKSINTIQRVSGAIQGAQQVKNITDMKNQQGNPYDTRLGNPGIMPKKRTWEMPKYAEVNDKSLDTTKKKKKLTNKQKAGIAIGTTVGALVLADILSKGDVFAPVRSVWSGAKEAPSAMFNKAERGDFGVGASVAASGVKKAVNRTKKEPNYGWGNNQKSKSDSWTNGKSGGSKNDATNPILKGFGLGSGVGAGILAAHILGDKILKNKQVKKSYDSKALTNKDIDRYHKTRFYPGKPVIDIAKNFGNSIKSDIDEIRAENQKSDKNR